MRIQSLPTLAVVGCGDWGKNIIRTVASLGALGALGDKDLTAPKPKQLSTQYDVPLCAFDDILCNPDIDGIILATPSHTHFKLAQAALEAGKHVLVEKPLVKSCEENEALNALATQKNLTLMAGHLLIYHPAYQKFKSILKDNVIGPVKFLKSRRLNLGKIYPDENVIWDLLPHDMSMVVDIMGRAPDRVLATASSHIYDNLPDLCTVTLDFGKNQRAQIELSRLSPIKEHSLMAVGSDGMLVFDDTKEWNHKLMHHDSYVNISTDGPEVMRNEPQNIPLPPAEPLRLEIEAFIQDILGHQSNLSPAKPHAEIVLKTILAVIESTEKETWVPVQ